MTTTTDAYDAYRKLMALEKRKDKLQRELRAHLARMTMEQVYEWHQATEQWHREDER